MIDAITKNLGEKAEYYLGFKSPKIPKEKIHVPTGDFAPSSDPREPYLAWATLSSGQIRVVVHNVKTDRTVATGWFDFVKLGIEHILTGYDHLLFLVALLATARGAWSVVRIVTAFTLAHSVTLSVAALGIVTIPDRIIEPLIAATIVWVALENLLSAEPDRRRWIWSFGFGLVHGFGFASVLGELGLKGVTLVRGLVGFNVGVEIGQLIFVAVFLPALMWLSRGRGARLTPRIASLAVAAIGAYWLVERIFVG